MADDPMYHDGMRRLQDARETRPLADRLEQVTVRRTFTDDDREFIQRCPMFFIATADAHGHPDCAGKDEEKRSDLVREDFIECGFRLFHRIFRIAETDRVFNR